MEQQKDDSLKCWAFSDGEYVHLGWGETQFTAFLHALEDGCDFVADYIDRICVPYNEVGEDGEGDDMTFAAIVERMADDDEYRQQIERAAYDDFVVKRASYIERVPLFDHLDLVDIRNGDYLAVGIASFCTCDAYNDHPLHPDEGDVRIDENGNVYCGDCAAEYEWYEWYHAADDNGDDGGGDDDDDDDKRTLLTVGEYTMKRFGHKIREMASIGTDGDE